MLRFLANLTFLYTEYSFLDRFNKAKEAGFNVIEFKFPEPLDIDAVEIRLKETGLRPYLFNFPVDVQAVGGRGVANNPERRQEFRLGVNQALEAASRLGVKNINFFCGTRIPNFTEEEMWNTLVSNLQFAADVLIKHHMNITFEPLNHHDNPGIFIDTTTRGLELQRAIGRSNVFIQFDVYHSRKEGEDIFAILRNHMSSIGHIQIADYPGRHQPGTGEVDIERFIQMIKDSSYRGYVSLEYMPSPDTAESLKWFAEKDYELGGDWNA